MCMRLPRFLAFFALLSAPAFAQSYTTVQWGLDKTASPYAFGANIGGTWRNLGTVSSTGAWTLTPSALTVSGAATFNGGATVKSNAIVSIFDYAACNGSADDSAGFLIASASNKEILIPTNASCKISTDTLITIGSKWTVEKGGTINVTTGRTLTMRAKFEAPRYQVFTGAGAVIGIAQSKPEWWGANGAYGNTFDSRSAFQAAVNSAMAAFDASAPTVFSDTDGTPAVDIGQGFFNLCTPVDVYPVSSKPLIIRGVGPWNSGTWIQTCSTFTGYAPFLVHGYTPASGNVAYIGFRDLSINNPVKASGATAGIRFVPEGSGYWVTSLQKASFIENIKISDFPINLDVVNFQRLKITRSSFIATGSNTSNNTGVRIYANGAVASGNAVSEISLEDNTFDACPLSNASTCTNTIGVDVRSIDGANVNALNFRSNVWFSSNTYVKIVASGANSWAGDIWFAGDGNQFDGLGCNYIDASAESSGSVFNVHVDGVYHTGVYSNSCIAHKWGNDGASSMTKIWDTNNHFVLGPSSSAINTVYVSDAVISGNIIDGGTNTSDAIAIALSNNIAASNNVVKGTWRWGVSLDANTTNTTVTGNECNGASLVGDCTNDATSLATTTNDVNANSDRKFGPARLTLKTYIISALPTCGAALLGTIATVSNGLGWPTTWGTAGNAVPAGFPGTAVSTTGAVTRSVICTNTGGATTYAWAYN